MTKGCLPDLFCCICQTKLEICDNLKFLQLEEFLNNNKNFLKYKIVLNLAEINFLIVLAI